MGSGKSTVAKLLSKSLGLPLIEMDDEILKRSNRSTIAEIFSIDGEDTFRKLERTVAENLSSVSDAVISTGGGVVEFDQTMQSLINGANVFLLDASFATISSRIADVESRPLFASRERAEDLFNRRRPLYLQFGSEVIATDHLSPDQVAEEILRRFTEVSSL